MRVPGAVALLLLGSWAEASAQAPAPLVVRATVGTVFEDRNANGVRDHGEPGVEGVVVSNQDDVTRTDATGSYRLGATGFGAVFISVPDGHRA